jgi:hypothetical protein
MTVEQKFATKLACRIAEVNPARLNEDIAAGDYPCPPDTIPGRARYFSRHSLVSLVLYQQLQNQGYHKKAAGYIACSVGAAAQEFPDSPAIAYVQRRGTHKGIAMPSDKATAPETWAHEAMAPYHASNINTFNIAVIRAYLEHQIEEELSYIGEED